MTGNVADTYRDLKKGSHVAPQSINGSKWRKPGTLNATSQHPFARARLFERPDHDTVDLAGDVDGAQFLDMDDDAEADEGAAPHTAFCTPDFTNDAQDLGVCLTLHQPWASLLAYGFKRLEGRIWQTDYRGRYCYQFTAIHPSRLWIHAASKVPEDSTVNAMCAYLHRVYGRHPPLPSAWPTSSLVGCVDLIDCIPKEKVKEAILSGKYSRDGQRLISIREDNDSPYLFVCKSPRILVVPIQMSGEHKLWYLPRHRLPAFQRSLRPVLWKVLDPQLEVSTTVVGDYLPASNVATVDLRKFIRRPLANSLSLKPDMSSDKVVALNSNILRLESVLADGNIDQLVDDVKSAVDVNPFYLHEQMGLCFADFGSHYSSSSREWDTIRHDVDGSEMPPIPQRFTILFEAFVNEILLTKFAAVSSVGGPHVPPLESLQLLFVDPPKLSLSFKNLSLGPGDPTLFLMLSGSCSVVFETDTSKKCLEGKLTKESLHLIQRDHVATCDLKRGDCLYISVASKITNLFRLRMTEEDPIEGCLLCVMRSNLWKD
eukprot:Gregarina_sp_Poly_1__10844@NODE_83_length_15529_cov_95_045531_g71_i0_p3_GENE_NODE_83_length_15529_cov_95_045531_g71_i0NODE_83_length_15529_cov_95_045531_g71_i0_p3_ORF_typecomplete_len543_score68_72ASCH/PF04266_14/1_1e08_NODE_83_length_15529_cov_95_045531_g71_i01138713015